MIDRERLIKVLRMFGSEHDGEVVAAARRAHAMLAAESEGWEDIIKSPNHRKQNKREPDPTIVSIIELALSLRDHLPRWERSFLSSINEKIYDYGGLTYKQRAVLYGIINDLKTLDVWPSDDD